MSDCGCQKAREDLEEYLHHELCKEDAADIREHLQSCPDCAREHRVGVALTDTVRRACRDEAAPEELRAQVLTAIRTFQASHTL
ncbi:MAG TPA: zf-HC2 domain-containing protein [Microbacteriaceae bacterium]|nr:zf-HC2 domain-containing protein [Microbacteriaceae bacterium]